MIRHIYILIGETLWRAGTAVMRGDQLADILRPEAEAEGFQVSVTRGLTEVRDAAVIMNKTAFTEYGAAGVE